MKITRYFLIFLSVTLTVLAFAETPTEADRRKAEFIFMEAATAAADGRGDDHLMLLRRAAALAPDDPFIRGALAEDIMSGGVRDQALLKEVAKDVIDRYYAEPTIFVNGRTAVQTARFLGDRDLEIDILETMHRNLPKNQEVTLSLSDAYMSQFFDESNPTDSTSYRKGMEILERLVSAAPDNLMYTARIVRPMLLLGDTTAVENRLEILRQAAPEDVNAVVFTAHVYSLLDRDSLVEASFERGRQLDPQNGQLLMAMADYYRQKADSVAYDREVFAALSAPDLEFDVKLPLLKDYVVALYDDPAQQPRIDALFELMQQTNPGEEELHNLYGSYLVATERPEDGIDQYNVALSLQPSNQALYTELTRLNLVTKRYHNAIEVGREGISRFPDDLWLAVLTSYAMTEMDSIGAAVEMLENFNTDILNEKGKGELYSRLGDIYHLADRDPEAFDAYEKAILFDAENYMAMNNLAYFYAEADTLLSRAEMYVTLALAQEPDSPTYIDTYAWVLYKQNRFKEAAEQIDLALANCNIPDSIAKILGSYAPQAKKAEDDEAADATRDVSAEILEHAGDIYFFLREPKKARVYYQAALELAKPEDSQRIKDKISGKYYFGD